LQRSGRLHRPARRSELDGIRRALVRGAGQIASQSRPLRQGGPERVSQTKRVSRLARTARDAATAYQLRPVPGSVPSLSSDFPKRCRYFNLQPIRVAAIACFGGAWSVGRSTDRQYPRLRVTSTALARPRLDNRNCQYRNLHRHSKRLMRLPHRQQVGHPQPTALPRCYPGLHRWRRRRPRRSSFRPVLPGRPCPQRWSSCHRS
jgi:hypothetical protein